MTTSLFHKINILRIMFKITASV